MRSSLTTGAFAGGIAVEANAMNAEYLRRGWALVPIPAGDKAPRVKDWQSRIFEPADFVAGDNSGVILGRRSGELVDIDLGCAEALALADTYLPATHAEFGRASKLRPHRLYATPNSAYESAQASPPTRAEHGLRLPSLACKGVPCTQLFPAPPAQQPHSIL